MFLRKIAGRLVRKEGFGELEARQDGVLKVSLERGETGFRGVGAGERGFEVCFARFGFVEEGLETDAEEGGGEVEVGLGGHSGW